MFSKTHQGYEGVVAKRRSPIYRSGEPSSAWVKAKHWRSGEFVIGGWSEPCGDHGWGLLVGDAIDGGRLRYRGRVEFGFAPGEEEHVATRSCRLRRPTSPFVDRRRRPGDACVEPIATAESRYLELSPGALRHETFRGLGAADLIAVEARPATGQTSPARTKWVGATRAPHAHVSSPRRGASGP